MPVKVDRDLCIGCGACTGVCPTASLQLDDEGKSVCNEETVTYDASVLRPNYQVKTEAEFEYQSMLCPPWSLCIMK